MQLQFSRVFFRGWTIIRRSYQCSSLVPSSWAGRRRCLTQGDRCHVLSTAPDRLAAGHHSSLLPSLPSTRTRRARTRRAHRTEGPRSPLEREREDKRKKKSKNESRVRGGSEGEEGWEGACLIIITSSPSMKAVFFASHPGVNHPSYNPCICSTTLHFIGHLELRLW